jgi:hypothetical protein
MLSFFHSSTTCWGIIVSDYGLITTVAAAATFAALVLLIWIMHRTLSPRSKRPNRPIPSTDKKRKKRKGHMRHHHCRNGSGTGTGSANSSDITKIQTPDDAICISSDKPLESPPSPNRLDAVTPIPPCPPPSVLEGYPLELSSPTESTSSPQLPALDSSLLATTTATIPRGDSPSLVTNQEDLVHPLWASHERSRSRVHSVSTVDTSTMSDDQSCGSTSVRSSPSMSVTSSTLGSAEKGRASKSNDTNSRDGSIIGTTRNSKSGSPSLRRQQHKRGGGKSSKLERTKHNNQVTADVPMVASSRWDALKPSAKHDHPSTSNHYNQNHHRFNNRGGGGRGSRKGRSPTGARDGIVATGANSSAASESFFSLGPSPAATTTAPLLTETQNLNRPVAQSTPVVSRSPSPNNTMTPLPSILTMPASNHYMLTTSPPPPPPGLGPLPVVGGSGARLAMASSFSPSNTSLNGNHGLDLSPSMNLNLDWQNGAFSSSKSEMPFSAMDSILNSHRQAQLQHVTGTATPNWMGCPDVQESVTTTKQHQRQSILAPSGFSGPQYSPLKENPFAPDDDSQIEADLQELGGRMAGSILDF